MFELKTKARNSHSLCISTKGLKKSLGIVFNSFDKSKSL